MLLKRIFFIFVISIICIAGYFLLKQKQEKKSEVMTIPDVSLITSPSYLEGNRVFVQSRASLTASQLKNKETLQIRLNSDKFCLLPGEASKVTFTETNTGREVSRSLADYQDDCKQESQTILLPLDDFIGLSSFAGPLVFQIQAWYPTHFAFAIESVIATDQVAVLGAEDSRGDKKPNVSFGQLVKTHGNKNKPIITPTPSIFVTPSPSRLPTKIPTLLPTPTILRLTPIATIRPVTTPTKIPATTPTNTPAAATSRQWNIRSVSSMKLSKDRVCNPPDAAFIQKWVDMAVTLGVTHIAIETPYESPVCRDVQTYTTAWVTAIRARGLFVWHRHMPLAFEGIYDTVKDPSKNYLTIIESYIKSHPSFFAEGDIFTPIPEPQNGGISGITYCSFSICIFPDRGSFNRFLRDAIDISGSAFASIGLGGKIKIGYYGFDGFVAWGHNNPDWDGILEDTTIQKMGNITIDHYPEAVATTMEQDLDELEARYPGVPIIIGEWGTITGGDTESQVQKTLSAASRPSVVGFNYWHFGMGGNESLISDSFQPLPAYDDVQKFFTGI